MLRSEVGMGSFQGSISWKLPAWKFPWKFPETSMAIIETMETSHLTFEKGSFFQISRNQYNFYGSFRKLPEILETLLKYI